MPPIGEVAGGPGVAVVFIVITRVFQAILQADNIPGVLAVITVLSGSVNNVVGGG